MIVKIGSNHVTSNCNHKSAKQISLIPPPSPQSCHYARSLIYYPTFPVFHEVRGCVCCWLTKHTQRHNTQRTLLWDITAWVEALLRGTSAVCTAGSATTASVTSTDFEKFICKCSCVWSRRPERNQTLPDCLVVREGPSLSSLRWIKSLNGIIAHCSTRQTTTVAELFYHHLIIYHCCYCLAGKGRSVTPLWPQSTAPSKSLQVEGCYLSRDEWPICYWDGLGDVATDCLVVDWAIGWCDSWVPCGLERHLAVWLHGRKGQWLMVSEMDGRPIVVEMSSFQMNWCHFICSSCLWHFIWKASRALESVERRDQVSAVYNNTNSTRAW